LNTFYGNGSATSKNTASTSNSNNFGLGIIGGSQDNLVENNKIGGNVNGVYLAALVTGNIIRRNIIVGNPPVQVSKDYGTAIGADIQDLSPAGTNIFEDNRCLTYAGKTDPAPCPSISHGGREEDGQREAMAAFIRNRLATQARVFHAVFRPDGPLFPEAVLLAIPAQIADPNSVTVTGKVVDAACYMLHVAAAMSVSHMECGAACLARGVPLAIATDDGILYFPADGNQRLKTLLNVRVRASGTVVEKHDPMELKMPVGDKNQMTVRVEGGYKQITIDTLEKVTTRKRSGS
jgi:hypothetical protein